MVRQLTDDELRARALEVLTEKLGPSQTIRFLSWLRNKPRDYQAWRSEYFKGFTADQLIERMHAMEGDKPAASRGSEARPNEQ